MEDEALLIGRQLRCGEGPAAGTREEREDERPSRRSCHERCFGYGFYRITYSASRHTVCGTGAGAGTGTGTGMHGTAV